MNDLFYFLAFIALFSSAMFFYFFLSRHPQNRNANRKSKHGFQLGRSKGWTLRAIRTGEFNADETYRPTWIENLNTSDKLELEYIAEEKLVAIIDPHHHILGFLPKSATEKMKRHLEEGRVGKIMVLKKGENGEHPELVLVIDIRE